jgi:hypothetical protein
VSYFKFGHAKKSAKRHHRIGNLAADFVDHHALDASDLAFICAINGRSINLVASDKRNGLPASVHSRSHRFLLLKMKFEGEHSSNPEVPARMNEMRIADMSNDVAQSTLDKTPAAQAAE